MNKKETTARKNTPDILGNLMGSLETTLEPENNKTLSPENNIAIQKEACLANVFEPSNKAIKSDKQESNKTIMDTSKEKTTFNLSQETLNNLEDVWIRLRRKLKGEQRITKTLIVEKALEIVLHDFEAKSELSDLYTRLKK